MSGDGPAIVFIHGINLNRELWEPQVEAFESSYTVLRYDLRGHGETSGSSVDEYSSDLLADDLQALLETLDIKNPVVCGHSLGAAVALQYAINYPDGISRLVLIGAGVPGRFATIKLKLLAKVSTLSHKVLSANRAASVEDFMVNLLTNRDKVQATGYPGD